MVHHWATNGEPPTDVENLARWCRRPVIIKCMAGIVSVVSLKGGAAKTTTAVHLVGRIRERYPTAPLLAVDCDAQNHLSRWLGEAADDVHVERVTDNEQLLVQLPLWAADLDLTDEAVTAPGFIVCDVAGGDSELARAAMLRSDVVVVPCSPSLMDLDSAGATYAAVALVRDILGHDRPTMVFLPVRMTRTRVGAEVLESLAEFEELIAEPAVPQRTAVADAFGQGRFCWDMPNAGDVGDVMRASCDFVLEVLQKAGNQVGDDE
jgi:chromosome partitioning protein